MATTTLSTVSANEEEKCLVKSGKDTLFNSSVNAPRIFPFVRHEYYNTMQEVAEGITADKRFQVHTTTIGCNYYALPNVVVKADYTHRQIGGGNYNSENQVSVGLAYIGWFFSK